MKKTLPTLLSALLSVSVLAQSPIITAPTASQIGKVFTNQRVKPAGITPGGSGANQVWDFSGVVDTAAPYTISYVSPVGQPFVDSFTGTNLAAKYSFDTSTEYFTASSTQLLNLGGARNPNKITHYTSPVVQLKFPTTYGDSYSNAVTGTTSPGGRVLTGTDSFVADGYGTLKVPGHTYNNVLRTRFVLDQTTSVTGYTVHIRTTWYDYQTPGYDFFLFEISNTTTTTTVGANTITTSASVVAYAKNVLLGVNDIESNPIHLSVFPNPNNGKFTIATVDEDLKGAAISVTDLMGKAIYEGSLTDMTQTLQLPDAAKGLYLVHLQSDKGTTTCKITIE